VSGGSRKCRGTIRPWGVGRLMYKIIYNCGFIYQGNGKEGRTGVGNKRRIKRKSMKERGSATVRGGPNQWAIVIKTGGMGICPLGGGDWME